MAIVCSGRRVPGRHRRVMPQALRDVIGIAVDVVAVLGVLALLLTAVDALTS